MPVQLIKPTEPYFRLCTNEMMAVGTFLHVDLLMQPPACKHTVGQWAMRTHGPLTYRLQKLNYPIPPAGADPATYKSEEEVQPLGFRLPVPAKLVPLAGLPIQVRLRAGRSC